MTSDMSCVMVTHLDRYLRVYTSDKRTSPFLQLLGNANPDVLALPLAPSRGRLVIPLLPWSSMPCRTREVRLAHTQHHLGSLETRFLDIGCHAGKEPSRLTNVVLCDDWRQCLGSDNIAFPTSDGTSTPLLLSSHARSVVHGDIKIHRRHWESHQARVRDLQTLHAVNTNLLFLEDQEGGDAASGLTDYTVAILKERLGWCRDRRVEVSMNIFEKARRESKGIIRAMEVLFLNVADAGGITCEEMIRLTKEGCLGTTTQIARSLYEEWNSLRMAGGWVLVGREFDASYMWSGLYGGTH